MFVVYRMRYASRNRIYDLNIIPYIIIFIVHVDELCPPTLNLIE